jgi:hypothetical protein
MIQHAKLFFPSGGGDGSGGGADVVVGAQAHKLIDISSNKALEQTFE